MRYVKVVTLWGAFFQVFGPFKSMQEALDYDEKPKLPVWVRNDADTTVTTSSMVKP